MQPKFNLTATLHAKPEKRAELLKLLSSFVGKSRSEQGCVDYHFHVSLDDPNMFYFYENWAERGRLRSPHRARLSKGLVRQAGRISGETRRAPFLRDGERLRQVALPARRRVYLRRARLSRQGP